MTLQQIDDVKKSSGDMEVKLFGAAIITAIKLGEGKHPAHNNYPNSSYG